MNNHLLIIDPQNDFCDIPAAHRPVQENCPLEPALPVAGAHADMLRLAALIDHGRNALHGITVTLDSHHHFDIGHPSFWQREDGTAIEPFTQLTAAEVQAGLIRPRRAELVPRVLQYLQDLEATGRYRHMVWPVHCELGTWGHNVHLEVRQAYDRWEDANHAFVAKVLKGRNPYTEQYSAIKAEIVDPTDSETEENLGLIAELKQADRIYIAGEASSHCVKATTEHLVERFSVSDRKRLKLLVDCMSPVTGFESEQATFLNAMQKQGVGILTAAEALKELRGEAP